MIRREVNSFRRPKENNPEPGKYDGHLKPFGAEVGNMTMGGKYKWKADNNPPIGGYNLDTGYSLVHPNNRSTIISREVSPFRRPKESNPDPGQYSQHIKPFGSDTKSFTMGKKYKWKADENPPIGGYDIDSGYNLT